MIKIIKKHLVNLNNCIIINLKKIYEKILLNYYVYENLYISILNIIITFLILFAIKNYHNNVYLINLETMKNHSQIPQWIYSFTKKIKFKNVFYYDIVLSNNPFIKTEINSSNKWNVIYKSEIIPNIKNQDKLLWWYKPNNSYEIRIIQNDDNRIEKSCVEDIKEFSGWVEIIVTSIMLYGIGIISFYGIIIFWAFIH